MTQVKICGIRSIEDGLTALEAGADALGFVFAERSPRRVGLLIAPHLLAEIRARAKRRFLAVAVLGDLDPGTARVLLGEHGFDRVQYHGFFTPADLEHAAAVAGHGPDTTWAALRVRDQASLVDHESYRCEALLLDAWSESGEGGTGQRFPWELAVPLAARRKIVLAGGLRPENVAAAVAQVRPWMVDVASGVESAPGRQDPERVRAFVAAAKGALA